jgi:hypothetical protein
LLIAEFSKIKHFHLSGLLHLSVILSNNHSRTSSPEQDMSFATLCLHAVHVRMDEPQEEISPIKRSQAKDLFSFVIPDGVIGTREMKKK